MRAMLGALWVVFVALICPGGHLLPESQARADNVERGEKSIRNTF